jgi:tetratricopeptide (TPR) repeat protein
VAPEAKPLAELDDDALADRYLALRDRVTRTPELATGNGFGELSASLSEIANSAKDPHLRANASLLLGSLYETRGDRKTATAHYRHAAKLVPQDAGPWMALAVASAAADDLPAAVEAQARATELDPDNLENWLALGELRYRAGDQAEAAKAYAGYEQRRKGIIDGLTLTNTAGDYIIGEDERIGCAEALASAADAGTAVALSYALANDKSANVRAAVARAMGIHRLEAYQEALTRQLAIETDAAAKEAIEGAMADILADPIRVELGPRPQLPTDDPRRREDDAPAEGDAPAGDPPEPALPPETPAPEPAADPAPDPAPVPPEP